MQEAMAAICHQRFIHEIVITIITAITENVNSNSPNDDVSHDKSSAAMKTKAKLRVMNSVQAIARKPVFDQLLLFLQVAHF